MEIRSEPASSALATRLLASYVGEVSVRIPGGFGLARSVSATVDELAPPKGEFLVVLDDIGEGVGCGGVKDLGSGAFEIKRMWIAPSHRGRGYAKALLAALEDRARDSGAREVRLDTSAFLEEAVTLYRASGYSEIAPYNDNPFASLWFAKRLKAES
jgi:GNAT superfamily N-acetyltransferase